MQTVKQRIWILLLLFLSNFFPVRRVHSQRDRKIFIGLWYKTWLEEGYAQPGEPIVAKYAKYDKFSTDLLVKFLGVVPVGTMRIIKNNLEVGLPTLNDFEIKRVWKTDEIVEVTLLTIRKIFRRRFLHLPFIVLMKALYRHVKEKKAEGILIAADKRLFRSLTKKIRLPFIQIGQEKYYEGSITVPAYMTMKNFEKVFQKNNPLLAEIIFGQ